MNTSCLFKTVLFFCWLNCIISCTKYGTLQKVFCALLITVQTCCYMAFVSIDRSHSSTTFSVLVKYTEDFGNLLLLSACVVTNLNAVFMKTKCFEKILRYFKKFDAMVDVKIERKRELLCLICLMDQIEILSILGLEGYFFSKVSTALFYLSRNIEVYLLDVIRLVIFWMTFEMCSRFILLKTSLNDLESTIISRNNMKLFIEKIKRFSRAVNYLCNAMDLINKVYGMTLMFDVLFCLTFLIHRSIILIAYYMDLTLFARFNNDLLTFVCLIWIFDVVVSMIIRETFCLVGFW